MKLSEIDSLLMLTECLDDISKLNDLISKEIKDESNLNRQARSEDKAEHRSITTHLDDVLSRFRKLGAQLGRSESRTSSNEQDLRSKKEES